jgi:hypothetical protein
MLAELADIEARPPEHQNADLRCRRASLLDRLGRTDEARDVFLQVLAADPAHEAALGALGALLSRTGYRSAALTVFREAAHRHPRSAARVNLGNLLRQSGEAEAALAEFRAALQADPNHPQAHQGLGDLLAEQGDQAGAAHHWALGYRDHAVHSWTWRGADKPIRVLMPISVANGNIAARQILDDRIFAVTTLAMEYFTASDLPAHDVVLNAIGDADACAIALAKTLALAERVRAPIINHPAQVLKTGREAMAARLGAIAGITVPRIRRFARTDLAGESGARLLEDHGFRFPLLLRAVGHHTGRHFTKIDEGSQLAASLHPLPGDKILAISFIGSDWKDGLARKGRVMWIDGRLYPLHWAVSDCWKVHYFSAGMERQASHRAEEARFLADMAGVLGETAVAGLRMIGQALNLDYGGIDFGLSAEGQIVVYEANATMAIVPPAAGAMWDYRRPASDVALLAAQTMITRKSGCMVEGQGLRDKNWGVRPSG